MPTHNRSQRIVNELIERPEIQIAVDTEFRGTHTLTIQAATRVSENIVALKVYCSPAIPSPPTSLRIGEYLSTAPEEYGRFVRQFQMRPPSLILPGLDPVTYLNDLFGLSLNAIALDDEICELIGDSAHELSIVNVGHFLPADFARIYDRRFFSKVLSSGVQIADGKLLCLEMATNHFVNRRPVVQYAQSANGGLYRVTLEFRDTGLPFGYGSLDSFSRMLLAIGKHESINVDDKKNMERTFRTKTRDAYGYAIVDAANTLLVYEQMQERDRQIYVLFQTAYNQIPPLRATLGRRVSDFLLQMTHQTVAQNSQTLSKVSALRELMKRGGAEQLNNPRVTRYGRQTSSIHGGLLYSRSPTRFWHEAEGMLRDVDMSGCYNRIIAQHDMYFGRPVVFEPGSRTMVLRDAVDYLREHAASGGWYVRVTGNVTTMPNTLIASFWNALSRQNATSAPQLPAAIAVAPQIAKDQMI